jgi:NADPH:quinone reductase-like Zn-dependent oxidoreductase
VWDGEIEVCYQHGNRHVRRFVPIEKFNNDGMIPMKLHLSGRGLFENLTVCPQSTRDNPLFGEVEIEVLAASLNFRDVLNILGMYPGDPGAPGGEFAGVITRLGEGVTDICVGDEVIGFGSGCFQKYITANRRLIHQKPQSIDMAFGSTIPIVSCTVELCLTELVSLKAGETILIHAAAGGVGLVAVQYAQQIGARVIATSSSSKRQYLRDLGVQHVLSSRDADEFMSELEMTLGKDFKVDVVLNSLSDKYISTSIDLLSTNGRFIEIGKRNIWTPEEVRQRRADVQYHVVALDNL